MEELIRTPLTVIHVIACAFLILVVLLQPGKSGGLGIFASPAATQVFGGRGAGNFLTKITWVTTAIFFLSSITLAYMSTSSDESLQEKAEQVAQPPPKPKPAQPAAPAPAEPSPDAPAPPAGSN
jgi:preprotein translocase subunit SecG